MDQQKVLTSEEREFFILVREAATANPFGEQRLELDLLIAEDGRQTSKSHQIEKTLGAIEERTKILGETGRDRLDAFSGKDRDLLESVFLFLSLQNFHHVLTFT